MSLASHWEKYAANRDDEKLLGGAAVVGGGVAAKKGLKGATGREALFHGTSVERAKKIRAEGLKPQGGPGITGAVQDYLNRGDKSKSGFADKSKGLAFTETRKRSAKGYSWQQTQIDKGLKKGVTPTKTFEKMLKDPNMVLNRIGAGLGLTGSKGVVKMDVPTWKFRDAGKIVSNPEFLEQAARIDKEVPAGAKGLSKAMARSQFEKPVRVFKGGVGTEYIKGSKDFKRLGLREVGQFAKAHPGRFAGKLGLGLAGLAAVGYGAKKLIGTRKKGK
jgi:hypothetical protein